MIPIRAVIFDLGGTLVDWPDWNEDIDRRWALSYNYLARTLPLNADLAAHGLAPLLDEIVYTSDLPYSKPHPSVFWEVARRIQVEPTSCVMVGDRMVDDISGALDAGMGAVWKKNDYPWPKPGGIVPTPTITNLGELLGILSDWGQA